jgi:predicted transcriptional regulator
MKKTRRLSQRVEEHLADALSTAAEFQNRSQSDVLRDALSEYLQKLENRSNCQA